MADRPYPCTEETFVDAVLHALSRADVMAGRILWVLVLLLVRGGTPGVRSLFGRARAQPR